MKIKRNGFFNHGLSPCIWCIQQVYENLANYLKNSHGAILINTVTGFRLAWKLTRKGILLLVFHQ